MALKTTHAAGEAIKAEDMNDTVKGVLQNAHNIFELFLENFFAAKVTAFLGLFFDGFSDTTKGDTAATTLAANASSGQNELIIQPGDAVNFDLLKEYIIFDGTNKEAIEVASKVIGFAEVVDQQQTRAVDITGFVKNSTSEWTAQVFKPALTGVLTEVLLRMKVGTTLTADFRVTIQGVSAGKPDGVIVTNGISNTISLSSFFDENFDMIFTFATPPSLTAETDFAIVIETIAYTAGDWRMRGSAQAQGLPSPYTRGASFDTINSGSSWTPTTNTTDDLRFITKMEADEKLILTGNLTNSYVTTDDVQRSTVNFDTGNKLIDSVGTDVGDDKELVYYSEIQSFQTPMESVRLWVTRNFSAQFNLDAGISGGATTLTILGDQTGKFASGDIIDISTSDNLVRERKTLTAVPSFGGGVTTLTFSATVNAFTTSDFVERVDVIPQVSIVNKDAQESFNAMVFIGSIVDFANSEVEDEYSFLAGTPNEDFITKLVLSREDVSLVPEAKRLGVTLNE